MVIEITEVSGPVSITAMSLSYLLAHIESVLTHDFCVPRWLSYPQIKNIYIWLRPLGVCVCVCVNEDVCTDVKLFPRGYLATKQKLKGEKKLKEK